MTKRRNGFGALLTTAVAAGALLASSAAWADYRRGGWEAASPLLRSDGVQVPGGCPIESPGGRFIFTARNPGTGLDIFVNQRASIYDPFEPGSALPAPINDADLANDFCPTPIPDNGLYFVSNRSGSCGEDGAGSPDMYRAVQNPATGWSEPENLGVSTMAGHGIQPGHRRDALGHLPVLLDGLPHGQPGHLPESHAR